MDKWNKSSGGRDILLETKISKKEIKRQHMPNHLYAITIIMLIRSNCLWFIYWAVFFVARRNYGQYAFNQIIIPMNAFDSRCAASIVFMYLAIGWIGWMRMSESIIFHFASQSISQPESYPTIFPFDIHTEMKSKGGKEEDYYHISMHSFMLQM